MNGIENIVVDTNILIYYLKGQHEVETYFLDKIPVLSFINELEALSGAYFFPEELSHISVFLKDQIIINYRPELKEIVVKLRAKKKLKLPDAIVAATALYYNLPLVSSDKSFKGVEGLDFIYYEPVIS